VHKTHAQLRGMGGGGGKGWGEDVIENSK
jgi:hypothetical protein